MVRKSSRVLWFSEVDRHDVNIAGSFGVSLGEMVQVGFPLPKGFIVSSTAYASFIRENNLASRIEHLLSTVHFERADSLMQVSEHIKKLILHGGMSEDFVKEIFFAYRKLSGIFGKANIAVCLSPKEAYRHVKGEANLLLKIKEAWASFFEPQQMLYRHKKHLDYLSQEMAIVVQKMVKPERSGVMFTIDPVGNDKKTIVIEMGSNHYKVQKNILVITETDDLSRKELADKQIIDLAFLGKKLEQHYYLPQVVEWAIEGRKIYILKRQSFTGIVVQSNGSRMMQDVLPTHRLKMIIKGDPVYPGIATGRVRVVRSVKEINSVMRGDILVASETSPAFLPAMKRSSVIITDLGGRGTHAAIMGRQLGKPTVIGTKNATKVLKHGMIVTVNGRRGEINKSA